MFLNKMVALSLMLVSSLVFAKVSIQDEMGTFEIDTVPQRIVALEFSFVDALANLGVSPVGVADDGKATNVIPQIRNKVQPWTSVGSRYQPSLEAIAALNPDLIIADGGRSAETYQELLKIAPTVMLKSRGETYEENLISVAKIGEILGKKELINQVIKDHHKRMDDFAENIVSEQRFQFGVTNEKGLWIHGPKSYAGSVMERLGLSTSVPDERENAYIATTLEQLIKANPDVLLLGKYGDKTIIDVWQENPLWNLIEAVKNKKVTEVEPLLWSKNRGLIAAEIMAKELEIMVKQVK